MIKLVGLMQQHTLNKSRTVTRGGSRKPTKDKSYESSHREVFFDMVVPKFKENSERSLKILVKSLKNITEAANF